MSARFHDLKQSDWLDLRMSLDGRLLPDAICILSWRRWQVELPIAFKMPLVKLNKPR